MLIRFETAQMKQICFFEIPILIDNVIITSGQRKTPISLLYDDNFEELAFVIFFPKDKFGYSVLRYTSQRILIISSNATKFSSDFCISPRLYIF